MRILELPANREPREWGRIHGESFRCEIAALAAIRTYLCTKVGGFKDREQVMLAACAHLPVLERYDRALHDELIGIAEGAAISPEEIVIANHYTDLRDLDPDPAKWQPAPTTDTPRAMQQAGGTSAGAASDLGEPRGAGVGAGGGASARSRGDDRGGDGCSMFFAASPSGRILAQTWDMHATAIPYVMVLRVPESRLGPPATLLSVTGCLGMAGMNGARVAMAINNLFSTDATLGVVWPAMVRRALRETSAAAARRIVEDSPIGSGHHYFIADREQAYAIEASGTRRRSIFENGQRFCHTNHCLDTDVAAVSKVPSTSTTFERMKWLERDLARAPVADLDDAWRRLGNDDGWPRSICTNMATPESPHGAATCGAIAMNLDSGELWAQQGFIHNVAAERWQL